MKRQFVLLGTLLLSCAFSGSIAYAAPEPQAITQSTISVSGTVVDANGEPVAGASIAEIGTTRGTVTDVNGKFTLKTAPGANLTWRNDNLHSFYIITQAGRQSD